MNNLNKENSKIWMVSDKNEESFLRKKTSDFDFSKYTKKEIDDLVLFMRRMMVKNRGIGLSANQIGLNLNLFVCQLPNSDGKGYKGKFYAIFNPKVEEISKKESFDDEGCLSVPGYYGGVKRATKITISGFDKNQRLIKIKAEGLLARIFQHELDHLSGAIFIDKSKDIFKIEQEK